MTAVEGDRVDLKCDASGNPPPIYEWSKVSSEKIIQVTVKV